jgi:hypothetical protein
VKCIWLCFATSHSKSPFSMWWAWRNTEAFNPQELVFRENFLTKS